MGRAAPQGWYALLIHRQEDSSLENLHYLPKPERNRITELQWMRELSLTDEEKASFINLARELTRIKPGTRIHNPTDTVNYLMFELSGKKNEEFGAILLDNRHRVLSTQALFQGTINGASVHPRVVVQHVMEYNAAAVIFYHNHPSGDPEPSQADRQLTNKLRDILNVIDVRTLDHFVVGSGESVSFAERGFL